MNSSSAAATIAARRSAVRSARFEAGFAAGGLRPAAAAFPPVRLRAGLAGGVVFEGASGIGYI
jgi:hypothetical protein